MFGRVLTAMVTPFTETGEVNYREAANIACYLAENGSDGIVVAGTTGESPNLTDDEKISLFQTVREAAPASCKVLAGVGTYSTKKSAALAEKVSSMGLDGVMAVVPYYNKPSQEGLYHHFKAIAEATALPVMLYNIPGRSVVNMLPETVERLAQVKNICSLKEASGSMDQLSALKQRLPEDFVIYAGDDSLTLPMLALGAEGIISVAAHVVGQQMQKMVEAFLGGRYQEAFRWHKTLYPIFKGLFVVSNPAPVKYVLNALGKNVGPCQLPLLGPSGQEKEKLDGLIKQIQALAT